MHVYSRWLFADPPPSGLDEGFVGADLENARLLLSTPTAGGKLAAWAATIDRTTNDRRTLLPR